MYRRTFLHCLVAAVLAACAFAPPALAQPGNAPERVPVFIGFSNMPGNSEEALVRALGGDVKYRYWIVPAIAATLPEPAIQALQANPSVVRIEPDIEFYAVGEVCPWGVGRIGAPTVHDKYITGSGVKVAVIDSGIDVNHEDLVVAGGVRFYTRGQRSFSDKDYTDVDGHGTHVAGTIAALSNDVGVIGVAPGASLYAVKVMENNRGNYSDIVKGLEWCVENEIDIANLSLGSSGDPGTTVENAFNNAYYVGGLLIVAAAGNTSGGAVIYPAKYGSVIAVSATMQSDDLASFSSVGPEVELAAPGMGILSTIPNNAYASWSGTSMASPHVAGAAALILAASGASNTVVRDYLTSTAEDLGGKDRDSYFGYGLVRADLAVAALSGGGGTTNRFPTASFTYVIDGLNVSFSDTSTDSDGTVVAWSWNFGDGETSTAQNPTRKYATAGSYSVSLTVTDDDGASNTATATVTVNDGSSTGQMYTDLKGWRELKGKSGLWEAFVTVWVLDEYEYGIPDATVSGTWDGATSGSVSGVTGSNGGITFATGSMKSGTSVTFTVINAVKSGYTYDPESSATTVTVSK